MTHWNFPLRWSYILTRPADKKPQGFLSPCWLLLQYLQTTAACFQEEFPAWLCHTGCTNSKGVSLSLRQDSTRTLQNKKAKFQPTSSALLMSQNIPAITMRWSRPGKLTTGHERKIHKSQLTRRRWDIKEKREQEIIVWAENRQAWTGLTFTAIQTR